MTIAPLRQIPERCPSCSSRMRTVAIRGVEVDRCETCGGIWLDREELQTISQRTLTVQRRGELTTRQCPRCELALESAALTEIDGLSVESCTHCDGVFLDAGELVRVAGERIALNTVAVFICVQCGRTRPRHEAQAWRGALGCRRCALEPQTAPSGGITGSRGVASDWDVSDLLDAVFYLFV